jgi:predicted O-methyltransferase YrrM
MTSVTFRKARLILRDHGPIEVVRHGIREIVGVTRAYRDLDPERRFASSVDLVRFVDTLGGGVVAPFQIEPEIAWLVDRVRAFSPRVVVEIGTANGGTLALFARSADPEATITSIDLGSPAPRSGYPLWRVPLYRRFATARQAMHLLRADSHDPRTRARVEKLLDGRSVDFLFIDGDHSEAGVRADFELYGCLVGPGGLIGFHDIVGDPDGHRSQVHRLWNELKLRYPYEEIVADPSQRWCGIGLLHVVE